MPIGSGDKVELRPFDDSNIAQHPGCRWAPRKHLVGSVVTVEKVCHGVIYFDSDKGEFTGSPTLFNVGKGQGSNIRCWPVESVKLVGEPVQRFGNPVGNDEIKDRKGRCPACNRRARSGTSLIRPLPHLLVIGIEEGHLHCPDCGWKKGLCNSGIENGKKPCNGSLIPSYGGGMHCNKCGRQYRLPISNQMRHRSREQVLPLWH